MATSMPSVTVRRAVIRAVATVADTQAESLTDHSDLVALGLDSLDFSAVLVEIEEDLGQEIPPDILGNVEEVSEIATVGDVLHLLAGWDPAGDAG